MRAGELISPQDVQDALRRIDYSLKPRDIVLLWTGVHEQVGRTPEYWELHPGMSPEATEWLVDQGIKLLGSDAGSWDLPYSVMFEAYHRGQRDALWPSVLQVGRRKEFALLLKLANLEELPSATGFKVAAFPLKVERASSGWTRAVAIIGA
jgi:kynurenine formamidase